MYQNCEKFLNNNTQSGIRWKILEICIIACRNIIGVITEDRIELYIISLKNTIFVDPVISPTKLSERKNKRCRQIHIESHLKYF